MPSGSVVVVAGRTGRGGDRAGMGGPARPRDLVRPLDRGRAGTSRDARRPRRPSRSASALHGRQPAPLALAASVVVKPGYQALGVPEQMLDWTPDEDVIATLLHQLIGGPSHSDAHRKALAIRAHSYVTSERVLRALLGEQGTELLT